MGYWKSKEEEYYPAPQILVDNEWDTEERKSVIQYLDNGAFLHRYKGRSWCRFGCEGINMGSAEFTDGEFVWPEGFKHYIEVHKVKPPEGFIKKCISSSKNEITPPRKNVIISDAWWIKTWKRIEIEKTRKLFKGTFNDLKRFEGFFEKFTKDIIYQLDHIDFPVSMFVEDYRGNFKIQWIEEELWINLNLAAIYNKFYSNKKGYKIDAEIIEFGVGDIEVHLKDSELGILIILEFEIKDGEWKLTGLEDYSF